MNPPTLVEATRVFARIGFLSFGGPAAQIALMHRELVDERAWLSEDEYLRALSFCMLLPGPEAMQLATYSGWRLHGVTGGLIAGLLFVLPGAALMLALVMAYAAFGTAPAAQALLAGVKATVVVIVIEALLRLSKRALKRPDHRVIAALAFLGLFAFALPFPLVIAAAGAWGYVRARGKTGQASQPPTPSIAPSIAPTLRTIAIWGAVWLLPLALLWGLEGGILARIGLYFSQLAVLTFGGAYAVLAWMAQTVVADFGWLRPDQMLDALGLAETTPGPLILVTEFVGYLAAHQAGGWRLGLAGAGVTLWMTFAPCFLWIFAGAPWLEHLTRRPTLNAALGAITAAVVGVVANLSLWFSFHVFFDDVFVFRDFFLNATLPVPAGFNPASGILALLAAWLVLGRHWGLVPVMALSAALSWGLSLI